MPNINFKVELLPNVYIVELPFFKDSRGSFVKIYNKHAFTSNSINFVPRESFLTNSAKGVIRGMHFQIKEAEHEKLIVCLSGSIIDVIVDYRKESPNFNKPVSYKLESNTNKAIYIGKGYAHGFISLEDDSKVLYYTSTEHEPKLDKGILWSSIRYNWPISNPTLSERDTLHPSINEYQ